MAGKSKRNPLNKQQEAFVKHMADPAVLTTGEAVEKAGYSALNKNTKDVQVARLMSNPEIVKRIEARKKRMAELACVEGAQVLGATAKIAFGSMMDVLDEKGRFDPRKAMKSGAMDLVKKITYAETKYGERISIELYPKDAALAKLGNYLGLEMDTRPNPRKAALEVLNTIMRSQSLDMKGAIVWLLGEQKEKQIELVPPQLLLEVARENGIAGIQMEAANENQANERS